VFNNYFKVGAYIFLSIYHGILDASFKILKGL